MIIAFSPASRCATSFTRMAPYSDDPPPPVRCAARGDEAWRCVGEVCRGDVVGDATLWVMSLSVTIRTPGGKYDERRPAPDRGVMTMSPLPVSPWPCCSASASTTLLRRCAMSTTLPRRFLCALLSAIASAMPLRGDAVKSLPHANDPLLRMLRGCEPSNQPSGAGLQQARNLFSTALHLECARLLACILTPAPPCRVSVAVSCCELCRNALAIGETHQQRTQQATPNSE